MARVDFLRPDEVEDAQLIYVVIAAKYGQRWVFCRHKQRSTWEIPGGHREADETVLDAAHRELWEETGAVQAELFPLCVYQVNENSCGMLFYARITELGELPAGYEIGEVLLSDMLPEHLTYPGIQPKLFEYVQDHPLTADI